MPRTHHFLSRQERRRWGARWDSTLASTVPFHPSGVPRGYPGVREGRPTVQTELRVLLVGSGSRFLERGSALQGLSLEIASAPSVERALGRLSSGEFDIALLEDAGPSSIRRLVHERAGFAVVVAGESYDDDAANSALEAGAQDYLGLEGVPLEAMARALGRAAKRERARWLRDDAAIRDDLTGLLNRRGLRILGEQALRSARRNGVEALVWFFDLDGLKQVNDSLGHAAGDCLLRAAAAGLRSTFRESDVLARLGGDEFGAVTIGAGVRDVPYIRQRLEEALHAAGGQSLSASAGSAHWTPGNPATLEGLLHAADLAMYRDKVHRSTRAAAHA